MSSFGGPNDIGVSSSEGLALFDQDDVPNFRYLFLQEQPYGTTGLARRLNPAALYCACRWDYIKTSRSFLRLNKVQVMSLRTGASVFVQPVDWGPNIYTNRIIDLSPAVLKTLDLNTNDVVRVIVPLP